MTAEQFVYWLQGFMEITDPVKLNKKETQQIKNHLKLVFDKKTPDVSLPIIQREDPFRITPYQITCDDNNNFPDLMTTPVCSTTTITTTPLDPDIQTAMNNFAKEAKTESKRNRFNGLKC
jgi:hypothetical protein